MSTTIDQRVVEMRFDNRHFENNVATTMSTLDKLKQKLHLPGATKGFEDVNTAANKVNMAGLGSAVDTVKAKFSALEVMGVTALANITNSAVNAGKKIVSALTIDPIKTGFQEYETQINAVQTILANTESKGTTLQDVNRALDELNTYADKTIYNFTQMTRNIGTFTAAGVDLETSVSSIKGIANLAAVSGSTSHQASTAMYQLSQALAAGRVSLMDWNSVVNAGMGGEVFQTALKRTATQMGTNVDALIEKYGSFRSSLTEGQWLTTEVLTETLTQLSGAYTEADLIAQGYSEQQAKDIVKLAETAVGAATEVKTFTQLWETLKESAQSGWTQTWEILVGDFGEAKELLTGISDTIGGMINEMSQARNELLSGALSTGWKQLLGAGIADEEGFKDSIKNIAKTHNVEFDKMIEKEGSFEKALTKALQNGDISSQMMTESVSALCAEMSGMSEEERKAAGYTEEHVKQIEALDSGLKDGSISMDEFVMKMTRASGRENIIESLANAFDGLMSVIKPIGEAFREVFDPITSEQIYDMTVKFKEFTEKLTLSGESAEKLKSTFKGLFSVVDIVLSVVKDVAGGALKLASNLFGLGDGVLTITASFGDWLSSLRDSVKQSDILGNAIDSIVGFLSSGIDKIKEFGSSVKDNFDVTGFEVARTALQALLDILKTIGTEAGKIFSSIGDALAGAFGGSYLDNIMNTGMLAGLVMMIKKVTSIFKDSMDSLTEMLGGGGVIEKISGILDDVRSSLQSYQDNLKADTLKKIAYAIGILAAAIFVISTIEPDKLAKSLAAMAGLFGELIASLALFSVVGLPSLLGVGKAIPLMISLSVAILILSAAMKNLSSLDWGGIARGLAGVGGLMAELSIFLHTAKFDGKIASTAAGLVILGAALLVMSQAVKQLGNMKWEELGKGLVGVGALLGELALFTNLTANATHVMSTAAAMLILGAAMKVFASAVKDFAGMEWEQLGRGLAGMAGSLTAVTVALRLMPVNTLAIGVGLVAVAGALKVMASALNDFSGMQWGEIARGLVAMGGALLELAVGLRVMQGTLGGAAALLVAAGALAVLAPVLQSLGGMSWTEIGKGLVAIAGAFAVIGVAGLLLTPVVPAILGLAGALTLLGVAALGIGAGLALAGAGLTALGTGAAAGATGIVAAISVILTGFLNLIPQVIEIIKETLLGICNMVGEIAPQIVESLMILVTEVLNSLVEYVPQIVEGLANLIISVLQALGAKLPELIQVAVEVIGQFFQGVIDALGQFSFEELIKTILGIGLMAGLMAALSAIVGMIPGAMAGVLGMGVVIAELAIVLAAVGALAQIPGLSWLIGEGGNLLQQLGTAIGQFVGGLVGGIAEGATSTLPQVGTNLSNFMQNLRPFIDGASSLDPSIMEGVKSLATAILALTAADLLNGIASWISGGDSMTQFAQQLVPFGQALVQYSNAVAGVNAEVVANSAKAGLALVKMAEQIPNEGGLLAAIVGDNSLASFAQQMVPFGEGLAEYSNAVAGVNAEAVTNSSKAGLALIKMADQIPNEGGLWGLIAGDNSIGDFAKQMVPFGKGLAEYSNAVAGVNVAVIVSSTTAAKMLISLANKLSENGALDSGAISSFRQQIPALGTALTNYCTNVAGVNAAAVNASAASITKLVSVMNTVATANVTGVAAFKRALNELATVSIDRLVANFNGASGKLKNVGTKLVDSITEGVRSRTNTLTTSLNQMLTTMQNTIKTRQSQFQEAATQLMTKFINGIEKNRTKLNNVFKTALTTAVTSIRTFRTRFYDTGVYIIDGLTEGIKSKASSVASEAARVAKAALDAAKAAVGAASPAKRFIELGMYMDQGLANGLNEYAYLAANASTNLGSSMLKAVKDRLKIKSPSVVFQEEVGRYIVEGIADGITKDMSAEQAAAQKAQNIVSAFQKEFDKIDLSQTTMDLEQKLFQAMNPDMGDVDSAVNNYNFLNQKLPNLIKKATLAESEYLATKEEFGEEAEATTTAYNKYLQAQIDVYDLQNEILDAQKAISEAQDAQAEEIKAQQEAKKAAYQEYVRLLNENENLMSDMKRLGYTEEQVYQWAKDKSGYSKYENADTLQPAAEQSLQPVASAFESAGEATLGSITTTFGNFGTSYAKAVGTGVQEATPGATTAVKTLSDSCVTQLKNQQPEWYKMGVYLVEGFAQGITETAQQAVAVAVEMAEEALRAAEETLDIESPSKAFFRIGAFTGEGFINGLKHYADKSYEASSEMAESAKSGLKNAIAGIKRAVENDMDTQPTIRPVLDLTELQNGAGQIGGLFAGQTLALAGANAGYSGGNNQINDAINRMQKMNEAGNSELVAAIGNLRSDFGSLVSAINGMHIRMDSGTVVGELIGKIDSSLGQIANYKGRGN